MILLSTFLMVALNSLKAHIILYIYIIIHFQVSSNAKSLIKKLLNPDPKKRLGTSHGAADIKKHNFFEGKINFTLIRNLNPPMIPKLSSPTDTVYFRDLKDDSDEDSEELDSDDNEYFKDFTPSTIFASS